MYECVLKIEKKTFHVFVLFWANDFFIMSSTDVGGKYVKHTLWSVFKPMDFVKWVIIPWFRSGKELTPCFYTDLRTAHGCLNYLGRTCPNEHRPQLLIASITFLQGLCPARQISRMVGNSRTGSWVTVCSMRLSTHERTFCLWWISQSVLLKVLYRVSSALQSVCKGV